MATTGSPDMSSDCAVLIRCAFEDFTDKFYENQGTLWCQIDQCMGRQDMRMQQVNQKLVHVEQLLQNLVGAQSNLQGNSDSMERKCSRISNECSIKDGDTPSHRLPRLLSAMSPMGMSSKLDEKPNKSSGSDEEQADLTKAKEDLASASHVAKVSSGQAFDKVHFSSEFNCKEAEDDSNDSDSSTSRSQRRKFNTNERILLDARTHWRRMIRKRGCHGNSQDLVMRKSQESLLESAPVVMRCMQTRYYEYAVMSTVILNTIFIGWQIQYQALYQEVNDMQDIGDLVFCIFFLLELLIRFAALGLHFFRTDGCWNLFDLIVVSMMVFEQVLKLVVQQGSSMLSQMSIVRILRVVRIVRVVRVIRVLKFFRELRVMISSIMSSLKSLTWAMLVLVMMFYLFGISLTQGALDYCVQNDAWSSASTALLRLHFGTLDRSILSLFEAMSGGISWGELVVALRPLHVTYTALFLIFISVSIFAVVNIVTGVFVETALQSSQEDRESLIQDEMIAKEGYMLSMQKVFEEMDTDRSGSVTLEEFKNAISDERMVAYFNALGLDITDVGTLFVLLDRDRLGYIDIEEFLLGILRLKGGARSLDLAKLLYESEYVVHNLEVLNDSVHSLSKQISRPHSWIGTDALALTPSVSTLQL